jgi:signal peptidase II
MCRTRLTAFAPALAVLALDRLTKWIIETQLAAFDTVRVIPGFFDIVHSTNRGVAFGMWNGSNSPWRDVAVIVFASCAVAALAVILWRGGAPLALALILGGAAGNLFDRLVYGRVTDFLDFYVGGLHWPAFNVADAAIVTGCALLALDALRSRGAAKADVS